MNTRRTICQRSGGATVGENQVPPQAPVEGVAMMVNPDGLTDAEVWESVAQIAQAIIMQAQSMTDHVNM